MDIILHEAYYFARWKKQFEKQLIILYHENVTEPMEVNVDMLDYIGPDHDISFLDYCIYCFEKTPHLIDYSQN